VSGVGCQVLGIEAAARDYRAAKEGLAHRIRPSAVLDIGGPDGIHFLQGQLTQDVRSMAPGETRPAAALTPKGKLLFLARVMGLPEGGLRLILPAAERDPAAAHLKRFVIFQKVEITDRSQEFVRIALYGPAASAFSANALRLPGDGEIAGELLVETSKREDIERILERAGSLPMTGQTAEILRVEAGRPRFGQDADTSSLADEVGLDSAISTTKGCYVGQEIVARMRTYGRVNRRLVGFRFPEGPIEPGSILKRPEEPEPGKIEQGRVTSAVLSPVFGAIGLGYAFREVPVGARLAASEPPAREAVVASLPFTE
jgi:folate-binding protein YgfZ